MLGIFLPTCVYATSKIIIKKLFDNRPIKFKHFSNSDVDIAENARSKPACSYKAGFTSLSPMSYFYVNAQVDNQNKIIKLYASKVDDAFVM